MRAITPTATPATEIIEIREMNPCLLLAFRYLRLMNHSYPIKNQLSELIEGFLAYKTAND
jgi:hypothetical protein